MEANYADADDNQSDRLRSLLCWVRAGGLGRVAEAADRPTDRPTGFWRYSLNLLRPLGLSVGRSLRRRSFGVAVKLTQPCWAIS